MALNTYRQFVIVAAVFAAAACGSSTAPHGNTNPPPHPGINFLAGNLQTDSVQSVFNQALVVQITGTGGQVMSNEIVQFVAVPAADSGASFAGDWVDAEPLTSNVPEPFVAETTDTQGKVAVAIALGERAGKAPLIVKVPALGYVDTATFTVTAGNAAGLQSGPADTSVYVNGTVNMHTAVVDRFGNPRTDPVTYAVVSGSAHLSGSQVTVTGFGRVLVTGTVGARKDTSQITGVPSGTMAASLDNGGIAVFNLDGTNYHVITATAAGTVIWAPSGSSLVFDQTSGGGQDGGNQTLYATTTSGSVSVLDASGGSIDAWPSYSRDGTWIYYVKITNSPDIWRVHSDGTGDVQLTQTGANPAQFPSVSPDGTQLVFVVPGGPGTVELLNISSGVSTQLGSVLANSVAWAPSGNLIAYAANGGIGLVHSDGTGQVALTATGIYYPQLGWSPDGQWVAARNTSTGKIDLISVTTPNLILPLGYTGTESSPTWH